MTPAFSLRLATDADIPDLHELIEASVRGLQAGDYTPAQIEGALGTVLGLDTQLVRDETYFVAQVVNGDHFSSRVADGRSARRCLARIADRGASRSCSIHRWMRRKYGRFLYIRNLRDK